MIKIAFDRFIETEPVNNCHDQITTIHKEYFLNQQYFTLVNTIELGHDDLFIYPIQVDYHFFSNIETIFKNIPLLVQELVRDNNGYVLINYQMEPEVTKENLRTIYSELKKYNLPSEKIIYINGCINSDYCSSKVPGNLNVLFYSCGLRGSCEQVQEDSPVYDINTIPSKLFLVLNKRYKNHRASLLYYFYNNDLLDKSFFSFNCYEHGKISLDYFSNLIVSLFPSIDDNKVKLLHQKLPLLIDKTVPDQWFGGDHGVENYYQDSLISIITESRLEDDIIQLTEKIFKPIRRKQPFMVVGNYKILEHFRSLGFKTFDEFWSEEYDNIPDPASRISAIVTECNKIASWSTQDILNFKKDVQPIIEYNYQHLKNLTPDVYLLPKLQEIFHKNLPK